MGQRKKLKQMKHISYSMCKWSVQKKGSENNQWQLRNENAAMIHFIIILKFILRWHSKERDDKFYTKVFLQQLAYEVWTLLNVKKF